MKIKELPQDEPEEDEDDTEVNTDVEDRKRDYSQLKYIQKQLAEIYTAVEKSFEDKVEQMREIDEGWDLYNCVLNENQGYDGTSQCYVPIVHDAMIARQTRFINSLFPQNGRYADVVDSEGHTPDDLIALLDYYVGQAEMRTNVVPGMIRGGDISGNYSLYVEWGTNTRFIVSKEKKPELTAENGQPVEGSEEYDDVSYEKVTDEKVAISILDNRNLSILPTSADAIEDAEIVTVALRYTKAKIKKMIKEGIFEKAAAEELITSMGSQQGSANHPNTQKKAANAAGVKTDSKGNKTALIYQSWCRLKIRGEYRMMVVHFGGQDLYLGCKRNPYWNDRVPVITQALEKEEGSIWGPSQVKPVKALQYSANDVVNEGFDSAQYALLPIVMTDPEKNPQYGSMVLSMAAIWATSPTDTQFVNMPALWKDAFTIVGTCKDQIFQSLGVNPAMLPHGNASKKPSQAEVAQMQQVALESTSDEIAILESVLSKVLEWCYDLDYQYRTKPITVKKFGQMGLQATMDQVEPFQTRQRYLFRWYGSEATKAAQQVQQMISWGNVLMKMPPQMLNGRKVDLGPMIDYINEVTLGPRIAPKVLIDKRHQMTVDPMLENELMRNMFPVQTHSGDDDPQHIQAHLAEYQVAPSELLKGHILMHIQQLKEKAAEAEAPKQLPAPGAGGGPRPGAQAQPPTGAQQPAGAVHPDQMPMAMPRKAM